MKSRANINGGLACLLAFLESQGIFYAGSNCLEKTDERIRYSYYQLVYLYSCNDFFALIVMRF